MLIPNAGIEGVITFRNLPIPPFNKGGLGGFFKKRESKIQVKLLTTAIISPRPSTDNRISSRRQVNAFEA
jgi:hypothetical protein